MFYIYAYIYIYRERERPHQRMLRMNNLNMSHMVYLDICHVTY